MVEEKSKSKTGMVIAVVLVAIGGIVFLVNNSGSKDLKKKNVAIENKAPTATHSADSNKKTTNDTDHTSDEPLPPSPPYYDNAHNDQNNGQNDNQVMDRMQRVPEYPSTPQEPGRAIESNSGDLGETYDDRTVPFDGNDPGTMPQGAYNRGDDGIGPDSGIAHVEPIMQ